MSAVAAISAILLFLVLFSVLGIVPIARNALLQIGKAGAIMLDPEPSDEQKETAVQRGALGLLTSFFSILWRSAACLLASILPIYLMSGIGLTTTDTVFAFLSRLDVIVISSVVIGGGIYVSARHKSSESDYSIMDRAVHRAAFFKPFIQLTASDIEDSAFAKDFEDVPDRPPVFVTSLPRAGTTIILTALHELPGVATHLYRDMPFVMAPLMWSRVGGMFAKSTELKERAHGDGIKVGYDSPEAFEEVLWRAFWPEKFAEDHIDLWTAADQNSEATEFFRRHIRKIVGLRAGRDGRYVSKNNGNIARLDLIPAMFPGAQIVVPLRDPAEHAASLLRQHENFLDQHARDPFIRRYMHDIGHLEFGELHTPFAFDGFADLAAGNTPHDADYWLAYWIAANRAVLHRAENLHLVPQESLGATSQQTMEALCRGIGLSTGQTDFTRHFRQIHNRASHNDYSAELLRTAFDIYFALVDKFKNQRG